jgi:hypothetical protein
MGVVLSKLLIIINREQNQMSNPSKILAAAVGAAFLTMAGCASQGSGTATPENLPNNCAVVAAQNSCKNVATCKKSSSTSTHHSKKHHKTAAEKTTTTTVETSTDEAK